jgi:uncharacterized phiE125 gp8 family phage protein
MKRTLVTAPVYYPLVLNQVKGHLNIDYSNDDSYLQRLIPVATARVEQFIRRRLITQTWKVFLDAWPVGDILLPFGKLESVTHIKYTDTAGDQTTWSTDEYNVDTDRELGRVTLEYGYSWPTASLHPQNPIEIQFVCGYGAHAVQTITGASNASPIVITIAGHGYTTGDEVYIYDVTGNTAANGQWIITKVDANTFSLNGSTGNAAYVSGGSCVKQSVDPDILHAMSLMIGDMHENREDVVVGMTQTANLNIARDLLYPKRLHEVPSA